MERVYHQHRIGADKPFEETMPVSLIQQLVEKDLKKQQILDRVYGISITESQIEAEMQRIDVSTRAPDMLQEIKGALGNDPVRFADTVVRPILVEKILRNKYDNDDARHAATRKTCESIRQNLITAKSEGLNKQKALLEQAGYPSSTTKWIMQKPVAEEAENPPPEQLVIPVKGTSSGGRYSVESTVQMAQALTGPMNVEPGRRDEFYFEDLHPDLQEVLDIQLQNPGDVSAVIERPTRFHLYILSNRTAGAMEAISLTVEKHSYDQWLEEQPDNP